MRVVECSSLLQLFPYRTSSRLFTIRTVGKWYGPVVWESVFTPINRGARISDPLKTAGPKIGLHTLDHRLCQLGSSYLEAHEAW